MDNKRKSIFKNKKIKILIASAFGAVLIAAGSVTAVLLASRNKTKTPVKDMQYIISHRSIESIKQYQNRLTDKIAAATYWDEIDQGISPSLAQRDAINNVGEFLSRAKKTTDPKTLKKENISASLDLYSTLTAQTQELGVDVVDDWSWANIMFPAFKQELEGKKLTQESCNEIESFAQSVYNVDAQNLVSETGFMFDLSTGIQNKFKDVLESVNWDFIHYPLDLYYAYTYASKCINDKTLTAATQTSDSFAGLMVPYTGSGYNVGSIISDNDLSTLLSYRYDITFGKILTKPNFDYSNPPASKTDSYVTTGLTKITSMKEGYSDTSGTNYGVDEIFPGYKIHAKIISFDGSTDERTAKMGLSLGISNTQTDPQSDHIVWFSDMGSNNENTRLSKVFTVNIPITTLKYKRYIASHTFYTGDNDVVIPAEDYDVNDNVAFKNTLPKDPDGNVCGRYIENLLAPYFPGSSTMDFNLTDVSIPYMPKLVGSGIGCPNDHADTEHGDEQLCLKVVQAKTNINDPGIFAHWIRHDHNGNDVYDYKWKVGGHEYDNVWIYTPYSDADIKLLNNANDLCNTACTYENFILNFYNEMNDKTTKAAILRAKIQIGVDVGLNAMLIAVEVGAAIQNGVAPGSGVRFAFQIAVLVALTAATTTFDGVTLHKAEKWENGFNKFEEISQPLIDLTKDPTNASDAEVLRSLAADGYIGLFESADYISPLYKVQEATKDLNMVTDKIATTIKTFIQQIVQNFENDKDPKNGKTMWEEVADFVKGITVKGGGANWLSWTFFSISLAGVCLKFMTSIRRYGTALSRTIQAGINRFKSAEQDTSSDGIDWTPLLNDTKADWEFRVRQNGEDFPDDILPANADNEACAVFETRTIELRTQIEQDVAHHNNVDADAANLEMQIRNNWGDTLRDENGRLVNPEANVAGELDMPQELVANINKAEDTIRRLGGAGREDGEFILNQLRESQHHLFQRITQTRRRVEMRDWQIRQQAQQTGDVGAGAVQRDINTVIPKTEEGQTLRQDLSVAVEGAEPNAGDPEAIPENQAVEKGIVSNLPSTGTGLGDAANFFQEASD